MASKLNILMNEICIEWGFCLPNEDVERITSIKDLTADDFAREVLIAEGMDPTVEIDYFRGLRNRFISTFGTNQP